MTLPMVIALCSGACATASIVCGLIALRRGRAAIANWRAAYDAAEAHNERLIAEKGVLQDILTAHRIQIPPTPRDLAGRFVQ